MITKHSIHCLYLWIYICMYNTIKYSMNCGQQQQKAAKQAARRKKHARCPLPLVAVFVKHWTRSSRISLSLIRRDNRRAAYKTIDERSKQQHLRTNSPAANSICTILTAHTQQRRKPKWRTWTWSVSLSSALSCCSVRAQRRPLRGLSSAILVSRERERARETSITHSSV